MIDTGKQMDSALQRRSKIRSAAATTTSSGSGSAGVLSDYEKIALQIQLDVNAFGEEVKRFLQSTSGGTADNFKSYVGMKSEIAESVASAAAASAAK